MRIPTAMRRMSKRRKIILLSIIAFLILYNWKKVVYQVSTMIICDVHSVRTTLEPPLEYSQLSPDLLLVLIYSSINGRARRDTIRSTWVSILDNSPGSPIQYRFLLGGSDETLESLAEIKIEDRRYKDMIVLEDVTNDYFSLTERTIKAMKYVTKHYSTSYILKCDDDTFVDLLRVGTELQNRSTHNRLYWGKIIKWKIATSGRYKEMGWSIANDYLPYAFGGGYVLSSDLVRVLAENEPYLKRYNSEDVSVGAWLAPLNIERKHDARFYTATNMKRICKNIFLVTHQVHQDEMYEYFKNLQTDGEICGRALTDLRLFSTAMYDWRAMPSTCCDKRVCVA